MKLSPNFTLSELIITNQHLDNTPTCEEILCLQQLAVNILQPLRDVIGPVTVNSAFRSEAVNRAVGGTATSQHRLGEAADIVVPGWHPLELARKIRDMKLPYDQLIREPTWVHVSYGPRHRRQLLTMRRVNGRATYSPGLF